MRKVTSFEHACELEGIPATIPTFEEIPESFRAVAIARYQLDVISKAQANGFVANWANWNERKWFPVHILDESGFRFFGSLFSNTFTFAGLGSRPLPTEADADYLGTQHIGLFAIILGITMVAS